MEEEIEMMTEVWKDVEGFEGKYKISSLGRVWNTQKDVEVSQPLSGKPQYRYVNLHMTGHKSKFLRTHILVAQTFIPNPDNLKYVDHIDQDKLNNTLSNLRWVTKRQNQRNMSNNFYVDGILLIEKLYDSFGENTSMYRYIYGRISKHGEDFPTAIGKWFNRRVTKRRTNKEIQESQTP